VLAQLVMDAEVTGQIGAGHYERSSDRTAYRNGYRTRRWDTRVGTIELKIPKGLSRCLLPLERRSRGRPTCRRSTCSW
jgi:transposase-like protein